MTTAADHQRAWRQYPEATLTDVIGHGTSLILAPHPDDESLGCGGLIAACTAEGRPPLVVILTDGAGSHPNSRTFPPERLRAVRRQEVLTALHHLGLPSHRVVFLNQPDTAAPSSGPAFDKVVATLQDLIRREAIETILAPWRHDPHCDHEAASLIAAATGTAHIAYPVWGWTLPPDTPIPGSPAAGFLLDISRHQQAKQTAIQAHRSQYGALISDDPSGFRLPPELLSIFDAPYETFLRP